MAEFKRSKEHKGLAYNDPKITASHEKFAAERRARHEGLIYNDPRSDLMWVRNGNLADKAMEWEDAFEWTNRLTYGGFSDWRLPTMEELVAFSKWGGNHPAEWFNANGFNTVQSSFYWASNNDGNGSYYHWIMNMGNGFVCGYVNTSRYYVWPVRTGQ